MRRLQRQGRAGLPSKKMVMDRTTTIIRHSWDITKHPASVLLGNTIESGIISNSNGISPVSVVSIVITSTSPVSTVHWVQSTFSTPHSSKVHPQINVKIQLSSGTQENCAWHGQHVHRSESITNIRNTILSQNLILSLLSISAAGFVFEADALDPQLGVWFSAEGALPLGILHQASLSTPSRAWPSPHSLHAVASKPYSAFS